MPASPATNDRVAEAARRARPARASRASSSARPTNGVAASSRRTFPPRTTRIRGSASPAATASRSARVWAIGSARSSATMRVANVAVRARAPAALAVLVARGHQLAQRVLAPFVGGQRARRRMLDRAGEIARAARGDSLFEQRVVHQRPRSRSRSTTSHSSSIPRAVRRAREHGPARRRIGRGRLRAPTRRQRGGCGAFHATVRRALRSTRRPGSRQRPAHAVQVAAEVRARSTSSSSGRSAPRAPRALTGWRRSPWTSEQRQRVRRHGEPHGLPSKTNSGGPKRNGSSSAAHETHSFLERRPSDLARRGSGTGRSRPPTVDEPLRRADLVGAVVRRRQSHRPVPRAPSPPRRCRLDRSPRRAVCRTCRRQTEPGSGRSRSVEPVLAAGEQVSPTPTMTFAGCVIGCATVARSSPTAIGSRTAGRTQHVVLAGVADVRRPVESSARPWAG